MSKPAADDDIPELTGLRFLAATWVVISHLHALGIVSSQYVPAFLNDGRPAVTFFFVLSGFIMNHKYPLLLWRDSWAINRYARSRVARLYPTLLLSLLIALPTGIYMVGTHASAQLLQFYAIKGHLLFWLIASALAQLLGLTGWFPVAAINQPWNGAAWSLSCEFCFYALFPFLRPVLERLSSRNLIFTLTAAWALQGLLIVAIDSLLPPNRAGYLVYQFPLTHLFEFALGIGTGILLKRSTRRQLTVQIALIAILAIVIFSLLRNPDRGMPVYFGLSPLFAAVIAATVAASGAMILGPLRHKAVAALGHSSYALYMIHIPILQAALIGGIATTVGWIWLPLLLFASYVVHYGYAEPVRRLLLYRPSTRILSAGMN